MRQISGAGRPRGREGVTEVQLKPGLEKHGSSEEPCSEVNRWRWSSRRPYTRQFLRASVAFALPRLLLRATWTPATLPRRTPGAGMTTVSPSRPAERAAPHECRRQVQPNPNWPMNAGLESAPPTPAPTVKVKPAFDR